MKFIKTGLSCILNLALASLFSLGTTAYAAVPQMRRVVLSKPVDGSDKTIQTGVCMLFVRQEARAIESEGLPIHQAGFKITEGGIKTSVAIEAHSRTSCWLYPFWDDKRFVGMYKIKRNGAEYQVLVFFDANKQTQEIDTSKNTQSNLSPADKR